MSDSPFELLPTASNHAAALDGLYIFLTIICGISMVLVVGAQLYFMVKYKKRSDDDKTSPIKHNAKLEFWWSAIPAVFLMIVFVWGEIDFVKLSTPPADAIDVRVTGQKWQWTIEYPSHPTGGATEPLNYCRHSSGAMNPTCDPIEDKASCDATPDCGWVATATPVLVVPLNVPVRLTMTSVDVLHSFYIPAFRVKKDVVPGRYTNLWFTAIEEGEFPIQCTEYCGDEHSSMLAKVIVVPEDEYDAKVAEVTKLFQNDGETMPQYGKRIFSVKGCDACHSLDGSAKVGPSFKGIWGKTETLSDGSSVKVDDNYVRQSLVDPNSQIVQGYPPQMPTFAGQLDDQQITAVIEFLKSLE